MSKIDKDLALLLCCPQCHNSLADLEDRFSCVQCGREYPIVDGIPDFYPGDNPLTPGNINLAEKYETFGRSKSRPDSFPNRRRKALTIDLIGGESVLEIGAAEGWMTREIADKAKMVVSCDIAMSYLKRARSAGIDAEFMRVDAHFIPFQDQSFDCIVMTEILEHVYSPYRALEEAHRVLKKDGSLVLSVPNNLSFSNILQHLFNLNRAKLDAHLSFYDRFSIERLLNFVGFKLLEVRSALIYLPPFKGLFHSNFLQGILSVLFNNFGDKLVMHAQKTGETIWTRF